jgi:hypothetical protein
MLDCLKIKNDGLARERYFNKWMFVKADKPNSCYTFSSLIENLRQMTAEDMAIALKCKPEDLGCETAY